MGVLKNIFNKFIAKKSSYNKQDFNNNSIENATSKKQKEINSNVKFYNKIGLDFNNKIGLPELKKHLNWDDWEMDSLNTQEFRYYFFLLSGTLINSKEPYSYEPLSNNIWFFDYERDDDVKYGDFIQRMNKIADNKYPFKNVENIIEPPFGVKFQYKNKEYKWMFKHQRDWTDESFFSQLIELISPETNRNKFYILAEGQGGVIVFLQSDKIQKLEEFLGIKKGAFELLK